MAYVSRRKADLAIVCALIAAVTTLPVAAAGAQASAGGLTRSSCSNAAGTVSYELVFEGDTDTTVPPINATQLVRAHQATRPGSTPIARGRTNRRRCTPSS